MKQKKKMGLRKEECEEEEGKSIGGKRVRKMEIEKIWSMSRIR